MRLVIQRVKRASCTVNNKLISEIGSGFMVLVGIGLDDDETIISKMANKLVKLRVFEDDDGKMNLSLNDIDGEILSISQFTLLADCSKGNRPSFNLAKKGDEAKKLYELFNEELNGLGIKTKHGIFGADMKIDLLNDGPVTIIMDSDKL